MNDINEWSTEYNVEVDKIDDWQNSPHYWDKNVLYIKPVKKDGNYRYRLGLQMYPVNRGKYTIAIETLFVDYTLWHKAEVFINEVDLTISHYDARKFTYDVGTPSSHVWRYYSKTIVNLEKKRK